MIVLLEAALRAGLPVSVKSCSAGDDMRRLLPAVEKDEEEAEVDCMAGEV